MTKEQLIAAYWVEDGRLKVRAPFAEEVRQTCRALGGKWDSIHKHWILPLARLPEIRDRYLGTVDGPLVRVSVPVSSLVGYQVLRIGFYVVASRRDRDSVVDLYADLVAGTLPTSGGSVKNPSVSASADAVFEFWVPADFAEANKLTVVATQPVAPPPIADGYKANFATLKLAAECGDLALVSVLRKSDYTPAVLVCAMQQNDNGTVGAVPLAIMCDENPYEQFLDPTADVGTLERETAPVAGDLPA